MIPSHNTKTATPQPVGVKSRVQLCSLCANKGGSSTHLLGLADSVLCQHQSPRTKEKEVNLVSHNAAQYMNYLQKNKSHLIFQDEQKDYQPGNCGWEMVSGIEKFDAYSFPSLRTRNQESVGSF